MTQHFPLDHSILQLLTGLYHRAHQKRAYLFYNKNDSESAIADFSKVIELKHDKADAYFHRGKLYIHNNYIDKAVADFDRLIKLEPKNADGYKSRGLVYMEKGDYESAIPDFKKYISLKPDERQGYSYLGKAYLDNARFDEVISLCSEVLNKLKFRNSDFYYFRGKAYLSQGKYDEAVADLSGALKHSGVTPWLWDIHLQRGKVYMNKELYLSLNQKKKNKTLLM